MKPFLASAALLLTATLPAQITLEHTYPSSGYFSGENQLMMVDLEASGMSYVAVDRNLLEIRLYDLNHVLYNTISFAGAPVFGSAVAGIMYISQHLFDLDDDVEFMYIMYFPPSAVTQVYNEDGSLLLDQSGALPMVFNTIHNQHYPIYNTPNGAKLILSHSDATARVYGLAGTLSDGIANAYQEAVSQLAAQGIAFPNPALNVLAINLDEPLSTDATLTIMDPSGAIVLRSILASGSDNVNADVSKLASGIYFYSLTDAAMVLSGSFVRADQ